MQSATPPSAVRWCEAAGLRWLAPPQGAFPGVLAGVSARPGGVSPPPFASLNLSAKVGDRPTHVRTNLARLAAASAVPLTRAARLALVHGTRLHRVEHPGWAPPGDGLLTRRLALPLALTVADCLPLILAVSGSAVALVHAGWRGVRAGIATQAVPALCALAEQPPARVRAWLGPAIGPCCFTLPRSLAEGFPAAVRSLGGADVATVDLAAAVRLQLLAAGLQREHIHSAGLCTACHPALFFSHRRDRGSTGRMLAWVARTPPDTPLPSGPARAG